MGFNVRRGKFAFRRVLIIAVLFVSAAAFCKRLTPVYSAKVAAYANAAVNEIVNASVSEVFAEENGAFSAANNEMLEADTVKINRMKSQLMADIQNRLNTYEPQVVHIPLLGASKIPILSGVGPKIPLKIAPTAILAGNLEDSFEDAGINQVKHGVVLKISVSVNCTGYMFSKNETVTTDVPLIETVIKGDVPKYYGTNMEVMGE